MDSFTPPPPPLLLLLLLRLPMFCLSLLLLLHLSLSPTWSVSLALRLVGRCLWRCGWLPRQAEAAKEIPGHGKVREIERRLARRLLEEVREDGRGR